MNRKLSILAIIGIILVSAISFYPLKNLRFEFKLESFFPINDPDLDFFNEYQKKFNSQIEEEYIYIGLTNNKGVYEKEFLSKVDSLTKFIYNIESIVSVYSLTNTFYYVFNNENGNINKSPIVRYKDSTYYKEDSTKLSLLKDIQDFIISKDGKSLAISAFSHPDLEEDDKEELLKKIRTKINELGFEKSHLTAKILVEETYIKEIKNNLQTYLSVSLFLVCIAMFLLFRSFKAVVIPLITILFSVIWTLALITLFDYPIDFISSLLPPVLAVICMSDIIHISTKYIEELRKGEEKIIALKNTFRDIGKATLYTSVTTSIGFFTLCFSNIIPIRLFGLFAGIGVLLAFLIVIVFVFSVNINSPIPKITSSKKFETRWNNILSTSFLNITRHRNKFIFSTIFLLGISFFYINKIKIDSSLLQEIPRNNPILEDYEFIEKQFAGTRPFEMELILKDSVTSFLDIEIIKEMDSLTTFLKDSCSVGMLISHISFIKNALQTYSNGDVSGYRVPDSEPDIYFLSNKIMQSEWGAEFIRYMTLNKRHSRISGKLPDLSTSEFESLAKRIDTYFTSNSKLPFDYKLTGSAVLIDKTTYSLPQNMLIGLLIAFCVISLIVGGMFRSKRMILITLIANLIPLIFMAALMGLLGINLKADTSLIFSISFGIVVDDTIHYLNRLRLELSKGKSIIYANRRAFLSTGKAMIITTLILLTGFGTLLFSSFGGTFYIGLLVSLCLIFAVIIDLTILPLLILLFYKKDKIQL